jgi:WS/DGAT C-terminal domain
METVARMLRVIHETERIKAAHEPEALELALCGIGLISPPIMGLASMIGTRAIDLVSRLSQMAPGLNHAVALPRPATNFIATDVPGVQAQLYLAGREMIEMIGLVPLVLNLGYSVAIVSYNEMLTFGMIAEPHLMPDLDLMKTFAAEVLSELMTTAKHAAPLTTETMQVQKGGNSDAAKRRGINRNSRDRKGFAR